MARWAPLTDYLLGLESDQVRLSYAEVADIIGGTLPASASNHRPVFWSNGDGNTYSKHWRKAGFRASTRGVEADHVVFHRSHQAATDVPSPAPAVTVTADVLLVGCVKSKRSQPAAAKDLYTSTLFQGRRAHAEATGRPWYLLSSEYGVVDPDTVIEPYDRYLAEEPAEYRRNV